MSKARRRRLAKRKQKAEELFEPEELQRGYLTESDINIRRIDKPERFQVEILFIRSFVEKLCVLS